MTTCLGKSCSFGLPRAFRKLLSIFVFSYFPFGVECRIWDLIVSVPDHRLSFYFDSYMEATMYSLEPENLIQTRGSNISLSFQP